MYVDKLILDYIPRTSGHARTGRARAWREGGPKINGWHGTYFTGGPNWSGNWNTRETGAVSTLLWFPLHSVYVRDDTLPTSNTACLCM